MTQPLVQKTLPRAATLRDAELKTSEIDGVVMVGGATRTPHVRHAVRDFSGRRR